ncbi:hypothetical protein [Micromonospora sp. WMMD1082]|uniref:hypothetical protein n=1 Tax=Micromonospora sp. WMMD1082 TaxID=3016104 RepID=UPI002417433A|nr:hypothetical protein [Micromonospora sp. WMMD1082]MDG4795173.1 hypothetical protein [Micromonospora sp. WMMD1082]
MKTATRLATTVPRFWRPERLLSALMSTAHAGAAVPAADDDVAAREGLWGYAIRREWRNGEHDLFGFTSDRDEADRAVACDERFWRRGPVRPLAVYVVPTNAAGVDRHSVDGCRAGSCPDSPVRGVSW